MSKTSKLPEHPPRSVVREGEIETDFIGKLGSLKYTFRPDLRADTATRVGAKPKPRSHLAGLLRSERQLLANPPFNDSDWFRKDDDVRWQFGVPFGLSLNN